MVISLILWIIGILLDILILLLLLIRSLRKLMLSVIILIVFLLIRVLLVLLSISSLFRVLQLALFLVILIMICSMRQLNIQVYPASHVKQDQYPSISAAFEHFRQTGESVFDSKPSNSYDFGTDVDVTKADLYNVQKDTTLLNAYLLNHGEASRQELNNDQSDVNLDVNPDVNPDVTSK